MLFLFSMSFQVNSLQPTEKELQSSEATNSLSVNDDVEQIDQKEVSIMKANGYFKVVNRFFQ